MEILIVVGILIILIVIKNNKSSDDMPGIAKAYEDLQGLPAMEKNIAETYIDDLIEIVHSNILVYHYDNQATNGIYGGKIFPLMLGVKVWRIFMSFFD